MGEVDRGIARGAEQRRMWPGVATERKAGGRRGHGPIRAPWLFFKKNTVPEGEQI
jgi:hypothetical protein